MSSEEATIETAETVDLPPDLPPGSENLAATNETLRQLGMPELALVRPRDCLPQDVNARYMDQQTMDNLVRNVRQDGRLESVPLVHRITEGKNAGKYAIISGHHRVEAADKAELEWILVMVIDVSGRDELRAKQLSHNAISGKDDAVLLKKLYESIEDLDYKFYSGLQDEIESMNVVSLNFKAGDFQEFTVAFLPEDVTDYDKALDIVGDMTVGSGSTVRLADLKDFAIFSKAIQDVKKTENIKSNGAALARIVELGLERLEQVKAEQKAKQEAEEQAK